MTEKDAKAPNASRPPSVDSLARQIADVELPHPLLVDAARRAIAEGDPESARAYALQTQRSLLSRVVNATGTLLHTNLGRAPNGVRQDASFRNLELDIAVSYTHLTLPTIYSV